jgi:protein-disulfide isomerase
VRLRVTLSGLANIATMIACAVIVWALWPNASGTSGAPAQAAGPPAPLEEIKGTTTRIVDGTRWGDPQARVVLIEFSDFECPFCGRFASETLPQVHDEFVKTGKVQYAFRHFPLPSHAAARGAAAAAQCAAEQGQFWPMHDALFASQQRLSPPDLAAHAERLGLNSAGFADCLPRSGSVIDGDIKEGNRLGVASTPTFLVGIVQPDGAVSLRTRIRGAQQFKMFEAVLLDAIRVSTQSGQAQSNRRSQ